MHVALAKAKNDRQLDGQSNPLVALCLSHKNIGESFGLYMDWLGVCCDFENMIFVQGHDTLGLWTTIKQSISIEVHCNY